LGWSNILAAAGYEPTYDLDDPGGSPFATPDQVIDVAVTVAAPTAHAHDVDFGYTGTGSIGDLVWYDANDSCGFLPDSGEPGVISAVPSDDTGKVLNSNFVPLKQLAGFPA
jgi:hypothetical protein